MEEGINAWTLHWYVREEIRDEEDNYSGCDFSRLKTYDQHQTTGEVAIIMVKFNLTHVTSNGMRD